MRTPASSRPNSNFVSARMTPRSRAWSAAKRVERERRVAHLLGQRAVADERDGALEVDRLVVALLGLRRGREERLGQLLGLLQAGGQRDARDRAGGLVVLPAGAGDVAAHDALDRQHLELAHGERRGRVPRRARRRSRRRGGWRRCARVRAEPEDRQPGEHLALVGDRRRVDDVVGRDPVGGDHEQLVAQVVDLPDLARGEQGEVGEGGHGPEASNGSGPPQTGGMHVQPRDDLGGVPGVRA